MKKATEMSKPLSVRNSPMKGAATTATIQQAERQNLTEHAETNSKNYDTCKLWIRMKRVDTASVPETTRSDGNGPLPKRQVTNRNSR